MGGLAILGRRGRAFSPGPGSRPKARFPLVVGVAPPSRSCHGRRSRRPEHIVGAWQLARGRATASPGQPGGRSPGVRVQPVRAAQVARREGADREATTCSVCRGKFQLRETMQQLHVMSLRQVPTSPALKTAAKSTKSAGH
jgi:hypothetical protein